MNALTKKTSFLGCLAIVVMSWSPASVVAEGSIAIPASTVGMALHAVPAPSHSAATANLLNAEIVPDGMPVLLAQADVEEDDENDPLEPLNRVIFKFNELVYGVILNPITKTYKTVVPDNARTAIYNVLANLAAPVTFANDLLQFEVERAMVTVARFVVNTTIGMGGMADVAGDIGLEKHKEDFGQTLAVYGVGEGFYLVLPILGPSNPRDAVGQYLVDPYFDPLSMYLENTERDRERYARIAMTGLSEYALVIDDLEQLRKTSVDFYAAMRSLYRQRRAAMIANGNVPDDPAIPNYDLNLLPDEGFIATSSN